MKKITEVSIKSLKSTFLSHDSNERKKMLDKFKRGFELYSKNIKKKNKSASFNSDVYDFIEWAQDSLNENIKRKSNMKKSELRKVIREEVERILITELTTWGDYDDEIKKAFNKVGEKFIIINKGRFMLAPDLTGWKVRSKEDGKTYKIRSADEKFVQLIGRDEFPVGDGLLFHTDFILITPSGKRVDFKSIT